MAKSPKSSEPAAPSANAGTSVSTNVAPIIVKKLSTKVIGNNAQLGEEIVFAGSAMKYTTETSTFGPYSKFSGLFYARFNGVTVSATTLFLPEIAEKLLTDQLDKANGGAVDFNFALVKVEDKDSRSKTGYQWGIVPRGEEVTRSASFVALLG